MCLPPGLGSEAMPRPVPRRPAPPTLQTANLPAPIGGLNTVAPGGAMPPGDCTQAYNVIAAEYGLRARLGFREWCTGLDGPVRSLLPFAGNAEGGTANRLFACTATGIWGASASTNAPVQVLAFASALGEAGRGISTVASTPGGRFLLYCDEENGLHVYTEATDSWAAVASGVTVLWASSTAYFVGDSIQNGGNVYVATGAGTSASSGGPTGTGTGITDGTVTWNYVSAAPTNAIGPSLADGQAGLEANPANFVFPVVFKSRVWLVEKGSTRGWYLDVNAIYGTATAFDFGPRMRAGGPLVGLYNWSYDAGAGLDTLLVGLSTEGDVVIYAGTNPNSADSFGLKGTWGVGGVPKGRRIATDYGGDVLIASQLGLLPLSKLVAGVPLSDKAQYATAKIANLFNQLASTYRTLPGWALHVHPEDNALLVLVPTSDGQPTSQLAMAFGNLSWWPYRDLPMACGATWNGQFYFGTEDGRVCLNSGYLDNVLLSDADSYSEVQYSLLSAYQNLGNAKQKRVAMLRPTLLSQTPNPTIECVAKYGFNLVEDAPPVGAGLPGQGTWDDATWDDATWGGDYSPSQPLQGATGVGREVAIAVRGTASSRTVLVGIDVYYTQGGLL